MTALDEVTEGRSTGGVLLSMVPQINSGANWVDFKRRIEEYLVVSGLGITMEPAWKPPKLNYPAVPIAVAITRIT